MKRFVCLILVLILILSFTAFGEGGILMCINCTVNGMSSLSFPVPNTYTAIALLSEGQKVKGWKLNGELVPGFTDNFFVFNANGNTVVEALLNDDAVKPQETGKQDDPAAVSTVIRKSDTVIVKAVGASLQYLDDNGKGAGDAHSKIDFTNAYVNPVTGKDAPAKCADFLVTADNPHSSAIDYWVLNGVRYDFVNTVRYITVTGLTEDLTIEVVYKNGDSETLKSDSEIQAAKTGEKLIVSCENAKLRFAKGNGSASGDAFTEFDFTDSYVNKSSGKTVQGGSIALKVSANLSKVAYWELNGAKFTFSTDTITYFIVKNLDCPMKYVPHSASR